jgi:LmbE family N-acetylglucosaminyl deacetylase
MRLFLFIVFCLIISATGNAQDKKLNIIVFGAHPDDCDVDAGGTALLFSQLGHNVMFVSLTSGDAGHFSKGGGALAKIRRAEAMESGKRFGVKYIVLDNHDGELMPTLDVRLQVIRLIRQWNADVVIGPRTNDYHPDHRNTGILVQDAAYLVIVPNVAPDTPPLKRNPVFLYTEDGFQKPVPFKPDIAVDISGVYQKKIYAMAAHVSQFFEWLPWTSGRLEQVPADENDRIKWLENSRKPRMSDQIRESLAKWYGKEKAAAATIAEAFEICEFGRRPADEEIKELFPMLGK